MSVEKIEKIEKISFKTGDYNNYSHYLNIVEEALNNEIIFKHLHADQDYQKSALFEEHAFVIYALN